MNGMDQLLGFTEKVFADKDFYNFGNHEKLLGEIPDIDTYHNRKEIVRQCSQDGDYPSWMKACYVEPLLLSHQELHLFRKYNLLKFLIRKNAKNLKLREGRERMASAMKIRGMLVLCNSRLVANVVSKIPGSDHEHAEIFAECCSQMFGVVDNFDWRKGYRFTTYATFALRKMSSDHVFYIRGGKRGSKVRTFNFGEASSTFYLEELIDERSSEEKWYPSLKSTVHAMLRATINERYVELIERRYGINGYGEPATLLEIGAEMGGVSRERIRQLEAISMKRIKEALATTHSIYVTQIEDLLPYMAEERSLKCNI